MADLLFPSAWFQHPDACLIPVLVDQLRFLPKVLKLCPSCHVSAFVSFNNSCGFGFPAVECACPFSPFAQLVVLLPFPPIVLTWLSFLSSLLQIPSASGLLMFLMLSVVDWVCPVPFSNLFLDGMALAICHFVALLPLINFLLFGELCFLLCCFVCPCSRNGVLSLLLRVFIERFLLVPTFYPFNCPFG